MNKLNVDIFFTYMHYRTVVDLYLRQRSHLAYEQSTTNDNHLLQKGCRKS